MIKKTLFLLFCVCFFSDVSFGACTPASQWGDGYEYSECDFLAQASLTDKVKDFWGKPKLSSGSILTSNGGGIGDFILTSGVHCGYCDNSSFKMTDPNDQNVLYNQCPGGDTQNKRDDEAILAYVATDVSEHGAEFCLTQFTSASWTTAFFVYHQVPRMSGNRNGLKCAWYCEPGWDGDRCMTRGISSACDNISYTFRSIKVEGLDDVKTNYSNKAFCKNYDKETDKRNWCMAEIEKTDPAIGRTVVFDYKNVKGSNNIYYQQQIVIGATGFLKNGIKAKPIWLGGAGTHNQCGGADNWTKMYAAEAGGKERVLCLQGHTLNDKCEASSSSSACGSLVPYCSGWKAQSAIDAYRSQGGEKYFEDKPDKYYMTLSDNCKQIKCQNGMNFTSEDNYACSTCVEEAGLRGMCPSTKKCVWCGAGKCLNKATCACDECAATLSNTELKNGKSLGGRCWGITNSEDFRDCVLGKKTSGDDD